MSIDPSAIEQVRSPGLIRRIAAAVFNIDPGTGPQLAQQATTGTGVVADTATTSVDRWYRTRLDRLSVYADVDEMDESAEEVSVALDVIADNATTSDDGEQHSFNVTSDTPRVQEVLEEIAETAGLHGEVYSLLRNLIKFGDMFAEIVVNAEGQIVELRQLPPATMVRNQNPDGTLKTGIPEYDALGKCLNKPGECAFEQRTLESDTVIAAFYPSQIVHARLNWDGFSIYGNSMLRVTRMIWRKLKALDESLINARLIRAYAKNKHTLDTTGLSPAEALAALKNYMNAVQQQRTVGYSRNKPGSVTSDIFQTKAKVTGPDGKLYENASDIEILEARNEALVQIPDIKDYFHRKLLTTLRVPPALLGWEEMVNAKATTLTQEVEYVRYLRRLQQLVGQALEQVFDLGLLLANIDPTQVEYDISWPELNTTDNLAEAQAHFQNAQADKIYLDEGVIDAEWAQRNRFNLDDDEIAEIEADKAEQAATAPGPPVAAAPGMPGQPAEESPDAAVVQENGHRNGNGHAALDPQLTVILDRMSEKLSDISFADRVAPYMAGASQAIVQEAAAAAGKATTAAGEATILAINEAARELINEATFAPAEVGRQAVKAVKATGDASLSALDRTGSRIIGESVAKTSDIAQEASAAAQEQLRQGDKLVALGVESESKAKAHADRAERALAKVRKQAVDALQQELARLDLPTLVADLNAQEQGDAAVTIQYDAENRVIGAMTPEGRLIRVVYDEKGRVIGAHEEGAPN